MSATDSDCPFTPRVNRKPLGDIIKVNRLELPCSFYSSWAQSSGRLLAFPVTITFFNSFFISQGYNLERGSSVHSQRPAPTELYLSSAVGKTLIRSPPPLTPSFITPRSACYYCLLYHHVVR